MSETDKLGRVVQEIIDETGRTDLFLVDILFRKGRKNLVHVLVDTDTGIQLEDCVRLSRKLSQALEEDPDFQFPYTLEVSSPGIDRPLRLPRQYARNIGRNLQVRLKDGREVKGRLLEVNGETLVLEIPGARKMPPVSESLTLTDIVETKVQISFN